MAEVLRWYRLVLAHGYSSILCVSCNMITRIIIKKKELVFFLKVQMLNAWSLNSLEILEPLTDCVNHDKN